MSARLALALALLAACRNNDGDGPWNPTTVPYDPTCARCVEVGSGQFSHVGEATLLVDTEVDDPVAQWNGCANSLTTCLMDGQDVDTCVGASPCPRACQRAYEEAVDKDTRPLARLDAMDAVFFAPDGLCAPPAFAAEEVAP